VPTVTHCFDVLVDDVGDPKELRARHRNLFIRQFIELLQPILQLRPAHHPLDEFFWTDFSLEKREAEVELTRSTLTYFLCRDRENIQDLDRYLHHFVRHRRSKRDVGVSLEPHAEILDASEDVDDDILALGNIFSRLRTNVTSNLHEPEEVNEAAHQEKYAHASKNYFGGGEYLQNWHQKCVYREKGKDRQYLLN
jgi:hypothetical protein